MKKSMTRLLALLLAMVMVVGVLAGCGGGNDTPVEEAPVEDIPEEVDLWGMKLGREFFLQIREFDTFAHIGGFSKGVLIIQGDEDAVVLLQDSERAAGLYQNAQLVVFHGEGHGFSPEGTRRAAELMEEFLGK